MPPPNLWPTNLPQWAVELDEDAVLCHFAKYRRSFRVMTWAYRRSAEAPRRGAGTSQSVLVWLGARRAHGRKSHLRAAVDHTTSLCRAGRRRRERVHADHAGGEVWNPQVHFRFTSFGSSWPNRIEIWFGVQTWQSIRHGTFPASMS